MLSRLRKKSRQPLAGHEETLTSAYQAEMGKGSLGLVLDEDLQVCEILRHSPLYSKVEIGDVLTQLNGRTLHGMALAKVQEICMGSWKRTKTLTFVHGMGKEV